MHRLFISALIVILLAALIRSSGAAEWTVPVGGNAFHTAPNPSRVGLRRNGGLKWDNPESVYSIYFHVDRKADLVLKTTIRGAEGASVLRVSIDDKSFDVAVGGAASEVYDIGNISTSAGYVRVDVQGVEKSSDVFGELMDLMIESETPELRIDYVRNNQGNMFYWGRRGPSVHLRYEVPKDRQLQYAYTEVTVPAGQDPIGSFFMANGFGEGYFGMQVNRTDERRVLFSIWSPFKTDNPREIPAEQQIVLMQRGPDVHVGEFGNEGSGGQSYLVYPWKAGRTYRFLTEVKPDGDGNTVYASWFGDKAKGEWRLIARFRRPMTDTYLRGFHSFLESFSPTHGYLPRQANYGNVWVRDTDGKWHECTQSRLSVDATGRGRHRLDFAGGSRDEYFFMQNCGFFDETGKPGEVYERKSTARQRPDVQVDALP